MGGGFSNGYAIRSWVQTIDLEPSTRGLLIPPTRLPACLPSSLLWQRIRPYFLFLLLFSVDDSQEVSSLMVSTVLFDSIFVSFFVAIGLCSPTCGPIKIVI